MARGRGRGGGGCKCCSNQKFKSHSVSYVFLNILNFGYHDMKGKKEDDNGKPKSINESMHANQFADLIVHVELEQRTNCSRSQSMPGKETGRA